MSRLLGKTNARAYKKLKQTPSDDEIESSEEYTVFDKNDKSTIELQLVPSITENRKRPKEEFHVRHKKHNCRLWLLLLGIVVVAVSGLTVGVVLVRFLHVPAERINISNSSSQQDVHGLVNTGTVNLTGSFTDKTTASAKTFSSKGNINWKKTWEDVSGESCIRLLDVDGDGKDDILFGAANGKDVHDVLDVNMGFYSDLEKFCSNMGEQYPCMGYLMAVRGYDGQLLWKLTIRSEVFLLNCEDFDINQDGKPDCIGTGRQGCAVAFNPYEGKQYWSVEDDRAMKANWNVYQAIALPDWDRDGVPEVLLMNGGDPKKHPDDHNRESGRLIVVSGRTGEMVGDQYLEMPNSRESYMTPVLYHPPIGSSIVLFGSGGETVSGDFMGISVVDLCHYIYGDIEARDRCPQREPDSYWPNLEKDEKGIFIIIKGTTKGIMVPPLIVDVDGDSIDDILVSVYEGQLVLKNGRDLSDMWSAPFPDAESYSTPAPGYFDDDDILDFMLHWSVGVWPTYTSSNVSVISGKDGSILWTLESNSYEMTSDLILQTSESHRDLFLFKVKGLGSPFKWDKEGKLIRKYPIERGKRHGENRPPPHELNLSEDESLVETLVKDYSTYHITCEEDISRHRGEMFLVDRSTMTSPLKILDIPLVKYQYDAPYVSMEQIKAHLEGTDQKHNQKNHTVLQSHYGVLPPFEPRPEDNGHMTDNGHMADYDMTGPPMMTDPRKNAKKFETRCVLMDSDDRSTGAIGDLNGDGLLEYISIYALTGELMDTMYSYYEMKMNLVVQVVSLNLTSDQFQQVSVPSKSLFEPEEQLKDIRDLHMLPYRDQKWTQYMGRYGDSKYKGNK